MEQVPTIHIGVEASQMERKGIRSERDNMNLSIEVTNGQIRSLRARIKKVNEWLYSIPIDTVAPTMIQMMNGINSGVQLTSHW